MLGLRDAGEAPCRVITDLVDHRHAEVKVRIAELRRLERELAALRGSRRLLGCHVIGPQAADLVWTATVAQHRRGTLDEPATAAGIFPTLAEGMEGKARGLLRRLAPELATRPLAIFSSKQPSEG